MSSSTSNEASLSAILHSESSISMRTSPLLPSWRRDQWLVVAVLCATHLCNGMVVSLQAPFYPAEAERKGATAAQYGLVFGIFELTVFIVSPVIGKLLPKVNNWLSFSLKILQGARFLFAVAQFAQAMRKVKDLDLQIGINRAFSGGILTTGLMCVLFGFLNRIQTPNTFIAVSLVIRIVEAFGNSAFLSSSFTMVAKVFPSAVSTMFGVVEMAFGVGMIIGPTVGGALYQVRAGMSSLYHY